eukprot:9590199-Ditylum_brightwellii.AAC.1
MDKDKKQHMADCLEKDYGSSHNMKEDGNDMRREKGKKGVSLWLISNALRQMVYKETTTEHVCQGSDDPHDTWCQAKFIINKQILICCGKLDPTKELDPSLPPLFFVT